MQSALGRVQSSVQQNRGDAQGARRHQERLAADVDIPALAKDLAANEALQPMQMMSGGQEAVVIGLKEAVGLLLRHRLRPPLEVTLFVRNVFALNAFIRQFAPGTNLMMAMMPLVQKLPQMAAELE